MGSRSTSNRSSNVTRRRAHHAGSWYSAIPEELDAMLGSFLDAARMENHSNCNNSNDDDDHHHKIGNIPRAIISPHAGFSYSGSTAAYAYLALHEAITSSHKNNGTLTIVVLHPSHHVYLDYCALSSVDFIETPLGILNVDHRLRDEILQCSNLFQSMNKHVDEAEHSGEMQYPFIAKILGDTKVTSENFKVLPIMVGSMKNGMEAVYGKLLAPVLARKDIFCVVSSDFCHWGQRFDYVPWHDKSIEIHQFIKWLDHQGMEHISLQDPGAFAKYLKEYKNTICGRNPISVWMHAILENKSNGSEILNVNFVRYAQSSQVRSTRESSVSYASCVARKL